MQYKRQNDSSMERISASCKTNICFSNFLSFIRFGSIFLENIIHRANRKKGCREECHVYTWNQVYHVQLLFRICNMLLHASIRIFENILEQQTQITTQLWLKFAIFVNQLWLNFDWSSFFSIYWWYLSNLWAKLIELTQFKASLLRFSDFKCKWNFFLKNLISIQHLYCQPNVFAPNSHKKYLFNTISKKLCFVTDSSGQWEWFSHINFSIIKFFKYPSSLSRTLQFLFSICLFYCTNKMWAT